MPPVERWPRDMPGCASPPSGPCSTRPPLWAAYDVTRQPFHHSESPLVLFCSARLEGGAALRVVRNVSSTRPGTQRRRVGQREPLLPCRRHDNCPLPNRRLALTLSPTAQLRVPAPPSALGPVPEGKCYRMLQMERTPPTGVRAPTQRRDGAKWPRMAHSFLSPTRKRMQSTSGSPVPFRSIPGHSRPFSSIPVLPMRQSRHPVRNMRS